MQVTLKVKKFVNQLMTSNCYVIYDNDTRRCVIIDPGSEKSDREISFIRDNGLSLDYIVISHEHTDHNWGVNSLVDQFPSAELVCSEICSREVKKSNKMYFLYYYDDPDYRYVMNPPDVIIAEDMAETYWDNHIIQYVLTPGHSHGAMCIKIDNMLFTGDTIMPFKPYFNGRDSNVEDWEESIQKILKLSPVDMMVYPGHGDVLTLEEWESHFYGK